MLKRMLIFCALSIFVVSLTGCATTVRQRDEEIQGLKNQVSLLESQVQSKDEEINGLKEGSSRIQQEKETAPAPQSKKIVETYTRPKARDIQTALLNAGYNPGSVDGHMGKQTKNAIKEFQKANNLPADGKVGKKTWELLRGYLEKKIK